MPLQFLGAVLKLLVVSHACTTPQNQMFFERIRLASSWDVVIVSPRVWDTEYERQRKTVGLVGFRGRMRTIGVFFSGKVPLHFYYPKLLSVLAAEKPDAIYAHNESYALSTFQVFMANFLTFRKPIAFYAAQNIVKKYPFPFRMIEKFVFKRATLAFSVTHSAKVCLEKKGYAGRSVVLPLGINDDYLDDCHDLNLGQLTGIPIVGYVGRLVPEKGLKDLIVSLSKIKDREWICEIIGDGPQKVELSKLIEVKELQDRIHFIGYVDHSKVFDRIKQMSILVLPSRTQSNWKEQFGRVIIEALAAEVPVVGTDCGEIPYLINSLEGGRVVREGDVDQLADTLRELLDDRQLRQSIGKKGRANVKRQFSEIKVATDFFEAFLKPLC